MAQTIDRELLEAALAGYQQQLSQLQEKMAELRERIGGTGGREAAPARAGGRKKKRSTLSPEARERIAAAQRKRWAAQKKAAGAQAKSAATKKSAGRRVKRAGEGAAEAT